MNAPALLLYCRAGFEKECAAEISTCMIERGAAGFVKAKPDSGLVQFVPDDAVTARDPPLVWRDLAFARQLIRAVQRVDGMAPNDRATPLADAAAALDLRLSTLWLETADTNAAREQSSLCRTLESPLREALRRRGLLSNDQTRPRLHVCFLGPTAALLGFSDPADSAPWPQGIVRLRMPRSAASRSTLKLAEALLVFLDADERAEWLRPGLSAVDLGAAPGGWTWQLVRHGLHVHAIDNGNLDPALAVNNQVEHIRADGFKWRPKRPVDWLVCDMIEQPARIAALAAQWLADGLCRRAIFNLKLPMKKRWEALQQCRVIIESALAGRAHALHFKQLYHDRDEVTAYLVSL